MRQAEPRFVAQEVAQVAIRPRRLAYLIQAGNEQQMRQAIAYATTEWGGMSHPILPVRKNGAIDGLWRQVCSVLEAEVLIDYAGLSNESRERIAQGFSASVVDPEQFHRGLEPGIHTMVAVAPGSLRDAGLLTAGEDASLLETAALGLIPPDQQKTWVQTGAVLQSGHSYSGLLSAQLYERASSIGLTVEQIPTYQAEGVVTGTFIIIVFRGLLT